MMKPHFFWHLAAVLLKKRTPEVLTDVALLCVESDHNLHREVNIKPISYI
jgi:hypothetical protein